MSRSFIVLKLSRKLKIRSRLRKWMLILRPRGVLIPLRLLLTLLSRAVCPAGYTTASP
jgi:hypothetical protein